MESFCFAQKKAVFISIRYPKTSQTQDIKSQSTKPSLRELAQPKRDSAFEQNTHIVSCRETSASSLISFFIYNQKKQSRAQTDKFGMYSTSIWKVGAFLSVKSPITFGRFVRKSSKHLHKIQNDGEHVSEKIKSSLLSIRYRKTSQTQEERVKVPNVAFGEKSAAKTWLCNLNKKHVLSHVERSQQVLKTVFLFTTKKSSWAEVKKTFLERTKRRLGKFLFCSRNKSCLQVFDTPRYLKRRM